MAQPKAQPGGQPAVGVAAARVLGLLGLVGLLAAGWSGCVSAREGAEDASADGAASDTVPEASRPPCQSLTACDGDEVHACDHGKLGTLLEMCGGGQTCSAGRCTSKACAVAERNDTLTGCMFYGALADNTDRDDALASTLIVVNQDADPATASLQVRDDGITWRTVQTVQVPPAGAERFAAPQLHLEGPGIGPHLGFRVTSDRPLTVTLIESDDATEMSESSGGTMLLPEHTLGDEYVVMTYPQQTTASLSAVPGGHDGAGQVVLVGTADRTMVTVHASALAPIDLGGGLPEIGAGDTFSLMLNDGDVAQFLSRGEGADLSGTSITADRPLVVLSGNIFTAYGRSAAGVNSPDLTLEQMLPIRSWSQSYVAARLGPQKDTCDSLFDGNSALWRVLAAHDDTHVTFDAPLGLGGSLPAGEMVLQAGEVREFLVSTAGSFLIKADRPFLATQGMDCEATLSAGIATDSLWRDFRFALPANFDHELMIVRREGTAMLMDGLPVDESKFQPAGTGFQAARIAIPPCVGHPRNCMHQLEGTFGLTMRGMDVLCGYALTPQTSPGCGGIAGSPCVP